MIIDLYFLIPAVNGQIFNPAAEIEIPTGTPTNDANTEVETKLMIAETQTRKLSM